MRLARGSIQVWHSQTVDRMRKLELWLYQPRPTHCLLRHGILVAIPVPFEGQRQETESTRFRRWTTKTKQRRLSGFEISRPKIEQLITRKGSVIQ